MNVLMRLQDGDRDHDDRDGFAAACFRKFADAFYDNAHDKEVYLYDPVGDERIDGVAEAIGLKDGRDDPEAVLSLARGWNAAVASLFDAALSQLISHAPKRPDGSTDWLAAPSTDIYQLKKEAMALDGQVYDFAEHALLVNQHMYPTSVLQPEELASIETAPSDYVAFEVWPK